MSSEVITEKKFTWHPKFLVHELKQDELLFLSQQQSFVIEYKHISRIFEWMDTSGYKSSLVQLNVDIQYQASLFYIIDQLENNGLMVGDDEKAFWQVDYQQEVDLKKWNGEVLNLSQFNLTEKLMKALHQLKPIDADYWICIDDPLDPRLNDLDTLIRAKQKSWLFVRLVGESIMISPVFGDGKACFHCLSDRLLANNPHLKWYRKHVDSSGGYPVAFHQDQAENRIGHFIDTYNRWKSEIEKGELVTFTGDLVTHSIVKRPQCAVCGESDWMKQQALKPVLLTNSIGAYRVDGGVRSLAPGQTLSNLEHLIDPLTGIILSCETIKEEENAKLHVYNTSFQKGAYVHPERLKEGFLQNSLGKGLSKSQSKVGAICESLERFASQYQGDEWIKLAVPNDLELEYILPKDLETYSDEQLRKFENKKSLSIQEQRHAVAPYKEDIALHWTLAWSLTSEKQKYIPFTHCFGNTDLEDEQYIRYNSNGCAAGNNLEEAILQGLYEKIERDAIGIWWYNELSREKLDFNSIPQKVRNYIEENIDEGWEVSLYNLTSDVQVCVFAAIGCYQGESYRFGFGCHLDPELACQRAVTELAQLMALKPKDASVFGSGELKGKSFIHGKVPYKNIHLNEFTLHRFNNLAEEIQFVVKELKRAELEVLVVNTSRPDLVINTMKVIVPGLMHFWPELGNKRLEIVPSKLGYKAKETLNELALWL